MVSKYLPFFMHIFFSIALPVLHYVFKNCAYEMKKILADTHVHALGTMNALTFFLLIEEKKLCLTIRV